MVIETAPGFALRKARLERGLTLEQAAGALCVTVSELSLVEDGNFRAFTSLAEARVHIRCYAELLGLDPGPLLQSAIAAQPDAAPQPGALSASRPAISRPAGSAPRSRRHRRQRFGPAPPGVLLAGLAALVLSLLLIPAANDLAFDLAARVSGRELRMQDVGWSSPDPLPDRGDAAQ
jgi:cytoskeletal protein RodZ